MAEGPEPMWRCPGCGRTFASVRQVHTCRRLGDLDVHFARSARGMSFAAFAPRRRWLDGHLVLARAATSPRFRRVEV